MPHPEMGHHGCNAWSTKRVAMDVIPDPEKCHYGYKPDPEKDHHGCNN